MSRPKNVVQIGWYDTHPSQSSSYNGCWGVYPYFPSGLIIGSDMEMGLFILEPTLQKPCYYEGLVRDASNLNPLNGVKVKILGNTNQYTTGIDGKYYVGALNQSTYSVVFSKVAYYPDTVEVSLLTGLVETDTIDLVPIDPLEYTIVVTDFDTGDPIIGANIRIGNPMIDIDAITDGFGEASLSVYYPGQNKMAIGKWGYITYCTDTILEEDNTTLHYSLKKGYYDDFSFDFGWTTSFIGATQGFWERGIPFQSGNISVPNEDAFYDCTNYCYLTGNAETLIANEDDVQNGGVVLLSPVFDLTGYADPYIYFEKFFFNWYGPNVFNDVLKVNLLNASTSYLVYESEDSVYNAFWEPVSIRVLDYMPLDNSIQLRVATSDTTGSNNVTEAAFDYFMVTEGSVLANQTNIKEQWNLFPNPSSGSVYVVGLEPGNEVRVYDCSGTLVYFDIVDKMQFKLELNGLESGVYFVKSLAGSRKLLITNEY